jgi:hypothetical protein
VANVRATAVIHSVRFVKERYGSGAHERVLAALSPELRAVFGATVREAGWKPVQDVVAYIEKARDLLAPRDPDFFRELGRHAGRALHETNFKAMVETPELGVLQATRLWTAFYDTGRLEVVERGADYVVTRMHGFPAPSRTWCERIVGFWEGAFEGAGARAQAIESACVFRGSPYCEVRIEWQSVSA